MNSRTTQIKTAVKGGFTAFLKRVSLWKWIVFAIILVSIFPLFRYVKKQLAKNQEQNQDLTKSLQLSQNSNPQTLQDRLDKITKDRGVQASARLLAKDFGFLVADRGSWWDFLNPSGWTENDKSIADNLIYQRNNIKLLTALYFQITNSRDLIADIQNYLDADQLKRVRKYLKV